MPAGRSASGTIRDAAYLPTHPANTWRADPLPGDRWDETQNRLVTDKLKDLHVRPGLDRAVTAPAASRDTNPIIHVDEPSKPISFHLAPHTRQMMLQRKHTKDGNNENNAENRALWEKLELPICAKGTTLSQSRSRQIPCHRISVETGAYCDRHSCIAIGYDGYRCPNLVERPTESRYCSSGYHAENGREHHIFEAQEHRRKMEVIEAEQKAIEEEEMKRLTKHIDASYGNTPYTSPRKSFTQLPRTESDVSVAASSGATSEQVGPKTPPMPVKRPMPVISEVENWWTEHADPERLEIARKARGLGLKVIIEPVLSPPATSPVHAMFVNSAISPVTTKAVGVRRAAPKSPGLFVPAPIPQSNVATRANSVELGRYLGAGSKMAKLMTERFGNGFVRKQAFGRTRSQPDLLI